MSDRCPFCGLDPYVRVNVGIGSIPVAVDCCEFGAAYLMGQATYEECAEEYEKRHGHPLPEEQEEEQI